jgi:hypothetical protein
MIAAFVGLNFHASHAAASRPRSNDLTRGTFGDVPAVSGG